MKKKIIGIIDYGAGNLGSIYNAINYLGYEAKLLERPESINKFSHIILPGVGSFGELSKNLKKKNWPLKIKIYLEKGNFLLGICAGMQLLFQESDESKGVKGLGLIKGKLQMFNRSSNLPIPHVGFNEVNFTNSKIWNGIKNKSAFYFIHSYRITENEENIKISTTTYGEKFISFVEKENIFGAQFHPEKSHVIGLRLLKNFIGLKN